MAKLTRLLSSTSLSANPCILLKDLALAAKDDLNENLVRDSEDFSEINCAL